MENLSPHVSYKEAIYSETAKRRGINNEPNASQLKRMKLLCEKVFEPVRSFFNTPIYISSFFRTPLLNSIINGAHNSQHMANNGSAMDIDCDTFIFGKITNKDVFDWIYNNLEYDQLIAEGVKTETDNPSWIHCSYSKNKNRKETLIMEMVDNKKYYYKYDPEKGLDICSYR